MEFLFTHIFTKRTRQIHLLLLGCLFANGLWAQCPGVNPNIVVTNQITDTTAFINWTDVALADSFLVEYGPQGFPIEAGVFENTPSSGITLDSLNPCVDYDVYLYSICGDEMSDPIGPYSFTTTTDESCSYLFNLFDTFGDGWNGAFILVEYNGDSLLYSFQTGFDASFQLEAYSSVPMCISYSPGFFENEVSFEIIDPDGNTIYMDGPFPMTGNIINLIACDAPCPAPKVWEMADVNATNATTTWELLAGYDGDVFLEYGPMGFTRGTGTAATVPAGQVSFKMTGLEEKTWYNVYLGVDCGADSSKVIGPLVFETLWLVDVGVTSIIPNADDFCNLGSNETITVGLHNFGQLPQTLFEFYFAVNGVAASIPIPQDGLFTGVVGNDSTQIIEFETTWDFSVPGLYVIEAWTQLEEDSDILNDTFRVEFLNSFPKPVREDFEDLDMPDDWTTSAFFPFYTAGAHNNPTAIFGSNVWSANQEVTLTTGRIGPIEIGDTLSFDYRYTDWAAGTIPTVLNGDSLIIQISDDCEESYQTVMVIDSFNHVQSATFATITYPLDDYDGKTIHVRFIAKWASGDYWFDMDNINIQGTCPAHFGSLLDIQGTFENETNGSIFVSPVAGTPPYIFEWSDGTMSEGVTDSLENLGTGAYFVEITDAEGCMETVIFEIGTLVAADEIYGVEAISLYPNPTTGIVNLDVDLTNVMDIQSRVMDMSGRVLFESEHANVLSLKEQLDLSNQPDGLYIIQVIAGGKPYYAKLMVAR